MSTKDTGKVPPALLLSPSHQRGHGLVVPKASKHRLALKAAARLLPRPLLPSSQAGWSSARRPTRLERLQRRLATCHRRRRRGRRRRRRGRRRHPTRRAPSPSPGKAAGAEERSTESKPLHAISALAAKVDQQHEHAASCPTQKVESHSRLLSSRSCSRTGAALRRRCACLHNI